MKEENKRLKSAIEAFRQENQEQQEHYENLKQQMNLLTSKMNDMESKSFTYKNAIDRYRNENEQIKVDLTYSRASAENQKEAYDKLTLHYNKQVAFN
jgi:phage shock protein A